MEVIGEASDGEQALTLVSGLETPDVLFLDLAMPGMSGLDALAHISEILSGGQRHHSFHARQCRACAPCIEARCSGLFDQGCLAERTRIRVMAVKRGGRWLSSSISKTVIDGYLGHNGKENA